MGQLPLLAALTLALGYGRISPSELAGKVGLEPTTTRLTAGSTTAVLLANLVPTQGIEPCVVRLQGGCIASNAWRA